MPEKYQKEIEDLLDNISSFPQRRAKRRQRSLSSAVLSGIGRFLGGRGWSISPGWSEVGSFLGTSISRFYANTPAEQLYQIWRSAGIGHVNTRLMSLGGGMVMWGTKDGGTSL